MRRFRLIRHLDETGISGTGCVAQGVLFGEGPVVVRWLGSTQTTTIHDAIESVEAIHCHEGKTTIRWEDPICWQCSAVLEYHEIAGNYCYGCGTDQGNRLCYKTRPSDPEWFFCYSHEQVSESEKVCPKGPANDCMMGGSCASLYEAWRSLTRRRTHAR